MLSLFRRNLLYNVALLLIFAIALHLGYYFIESDTSLLYPYPFLSQDSILQNAVTGRVFVSVVLLFIQAMIISRIVSTHRLSRELSLIPAATFVLYCTTVLTNQIFDYVILANFFFVLSINSLFKLYKKYKPIATIFNSGFWLGLAAILYLPYIIFFISHVFGLINLRSFDPKEFLQLLFGMLCSIFLGGIVFYFFDMLPDYLHHYTSNPTIPSFYAEDMSVYTKPGILVALIIMVLTLQNSIRKKKKYDAIRKIELTYSMLLLSLFSIFLISDLRLSHLIVCSLPLAIIGGLTLERKEQYFLKELLFLLLIGVLFAFMFGAIKL